MYEMLCRGCPQRWNYSLLFPAGSGSSQNPFWCVSCVASCAKLSCGRKPQLVVLVLVHLGLVQVQVMSDVVCNQSWTICVELPHCALFVAVSTEPGCTWEGSLCM